MAENSVEEKKNMDPENLQPAGASEESQGPAGGGDQEEITKVEIPESQSDGKKEPEEPEESEPQQKEEPVSEESKKSESQLESQEKEIVPEAEITSGEGKKEEHTPEEDLDADSSENPNEMSVLEIIIEDEFAEEDVKEESDQVKSEEEKPEGEASEEDGSVGSESEEGGSKEEDIDEKDSEEKETDEKDSEESSEDGKKKKLKKKKGVFARIISVIEWILLLAAIGTLGYVFICTANGKAASIFGYNVLHVVTGSMEPTISVDDFILVHEVNTDNLEKDDIIAYYSEAPDIRGKLVIHRIVGMNEDGTFITRGDANPVADEFGVRPDQVLGQYKGRIEFLNWVASFVDVKKLLLLAVIIPMFLASIYEVRTIGKIVVRNQREKAEAKKAAKLEEAAKNTDGTEGPPEETEEEKIARWKQEAIEEYRRTHPDGE